MLSVPAGRTLLVNDVEGNTNGSFELWDCSTFSCRILILPGNGPFTRSYASGIVVAGSKDLYAAGIGYVTVMGKFISTP